MLKLKREFAGFYIIKGHSRDYEITISKSCMIQNIGDVMVITFQP